MITKASLFGGVCCGEKSESYYKTTVETAKFMGTAFVVFAVVAFGGLCGSLPDSCRNCWNDAFYRCTELDDFLYGSSSVAVLWLYYGIFCRIP